MHWLNSGWARTVRCVVRLPRGSLMAPIRVNRTLSFINQRPNQSQPQPAPAPKNASDNFLDIQVDLVVAKEDPSEVSLPSLIFFHSPMSRLLTKLSLLRLKLFWDWSFSERDFMENSKQAAAVLTDFVRRRRTQNVERCTTPMGFKQIKHDLLDGPFDWRLKMMRFEKNHFRRAIPLKVQLLPHYKHRFAFIDVVYVALRRSNDFRSYTDMKEMTELMRRHVDPTQLTVTHPLIFTEVFLRFRRDYSVTPTRMGNVRNNNRCMGQWLVSTFKIVRFDLLNHHPLFDVPVVEQRAPTRPQPLVRPPIRSST